MAEFAVDEADVAQLQHHAAHALGHRLIGVAVDEAVAAVAVGKAGHGVGVDGVVQLPEVPLVVRHGGKVNENEEQAQPKAGPEHPADHLQVGILGNLVVQLPLKENQPDAHSQKCQHNDKLHRLKKIQFLHGWSSRVDRLLYLIS